MKTLPAIILKATQYFLLGGILSFLLLLYLVVTDSYFEKLDWKVEGFGEKISVYFTYTLKIPIIFIALYGLYEIYSAKIKQKKILIAVATVVSLVVFIFLDKNVKHFFIISQKVLLNIIVIIVFYIAVLVLLYRSGKGVNR